MEYIPPTRSPNETDFEFELRQIIVASQNHSDLSNKIANLVNKSEREGINNNNTEKSIQTKSSIASHNHMKIEELKKAFSGKYDPENSQIQREIKALRVPPENSQIVGVVQRSERV